MGVELNVKPVILTSNRKNSPRTLGRNKRPGLLLLFLCLVRQGIAGEQIGVGVIPRAGLRIGKLRADAQCADLFARLDKIQLKAGQLILQVGRRGIVPHAVHRCAVRLTAGSISIFGGAALFQRCRAVVVDQPQRLASVRSAMEQTSSEICIIRMAFQCRRQNAGRCAR